MWGPAEFTWGLIWACRAKWRQHGVRCWWVGGCWSGPQTCPSPPTWSSRQKDWVPLLLDLSSAFDTVDHEIWIMCFHDLVSIHETALNWLCSLLAGSSREQWWASAHCPLGTFPVHFPEYHLIVPPLQCLSKATGQDHMEICSEVPVYWWHPSHSLFLSYPGPAVSVLNQSLATVGNLIWMNQMKLNSDKTKLLVVSRLHDLGREHREIYYWCGSAIFFHLGSQPWIFLDNLLHLAFQVVSVAWSAFHQLHSGEKAFFQTEMWPPSSIIS